MGGELLLSAALAVRAERDLLEADALLRPAGVVLELVAPLCSFQYDAQHLTVRDSGEGGHPLEVRIIAPACARHVK